MPEEQATPAETVPDTAPVATIPELAVSPVLKTPIPEVSVSTPKPATPEPASQPLPSVASSPATGPHFGRYSVSEAQALAIEAKRSRVQKMLDRIMAAVGKQGSITNDETEQLLHVSDRTASKYLTRLFKSGLLSRIGSNRHIRYEKK
jgi:hypothetical protein